MDGGFFTLVLTFFLIIFYSRIVDSEFCCMFTPSQRSETKNTTIMKTTFFVYRENLNTEAKELIKVLDTEHQAKSTTSYFEENNQNDEFIFFYTYTSKAN